LIPAVPLRGAVIRYAYLWADENRRGQEEGRKDRPAVVLALSVRDAEGATNVLVLAVTHTPPSDFDDAVPFPPDAKRRIGLDDAPAWIVTTEANAFVWPGPDVRPDAPNGDLRKHTGRSTGTRRPLLSAEPSEATEPIGAADGVGTRRPMT
jgi:hypothetical protein